MDFVDRCRVVHATGSYAAPAGRDSHCEPVYALYVREQARLIIFTSLRYDRPAEAVRKVLAQRKPVGSAAA